ncbi:hypothetical protein J3Q64DRAFT_1834044 [Phycomyces blakesleeanus]|uniref:Uncharacterized protein n=1 Tax=Phycomyces blakesleeanus TaxID=4837 RepID=A0ABR3AZF6_PHYBL
MSHPCLTGAESRLILGSLYVWTITSGKKEVPPGVPWGAAQGAAQEDPLRVSGNAGKPGWNLTAKFTSVLNTGLALSTLAYLERQPEIALSNMTVEETRGNNKTSRRKQWNITLFNRHNTTFKRHEVTLETFMGNKDCSSVFQKYLVSDAKSDREHELMVFQPSWRSNELQKLYKEVDKLSKSDLGRKGDSISKRKRVDVGMDPAANLAVPLPEWAIK